MPDYGLGRRPQPDARNARYPMRGLLDPLRTFFPRGLPSGTRHYRQPPALDQGNTGTCVGHGWKQFLTGAPLMTKGGPSPFDLYRGFVLLDIWSDNDFEATAPDADLQSGTSVLAGAKYLQAHGYLKNYVWAGSLDDVRDWHLSGMGTVVLGINWYEGMFDPDAHYFLQPTGGIAGGHCIKSTGWSDEVLDPATGERGALRIINNWGTEWGDKGRAWMSRRVAQQLLFTEQDAECCAAVEQKVTPLPVAA